jgi:c-di-AMP phosphodiesterase-like protein
VERVRKFTALPTFFKNQRLGSMAALVSFIAVVGAILAWLVNWVVGIIWVILVVIALIVIFKTLQDLSEQTTHYIENLSYRINRGEQESIIQMPLGVILNGLILICNNYLVNKQLLVKT